MSKTYFCLSFFSAVSALSLVTASVVLADENPVVEAYQQICPEGKTEGLNQESCVTIGGSLTGSAAAGMFGARKFGKADGIDAKHTKVLASFEESVPFDDSRVSTLPHHVEDSDRMTVKYRYSEERNRAYHIDQMEAEARSADSSASYYRSAAMTAAMPKTETYVDSNGRSQTRIVPPNFAEVLQYNNMADDETRKAAEFRRLAHEARLGAPVPVYDFEKVIQESKGNRATTLAFFSEEAQLGSSVLSVKYLPAVFAKAVGTARIVGGVAVGAAFVGVGVAIEEGVAGHIAETMRATKNTGDYQSPNNY